VLFARVAWIRLTLLAFCELIAGVVLYRLFTYLPTVEVVAAVLAFVLVEHDNLFVEKARSLGRLLCGITAIAAVTFAIAARFARWGVPLLHEEPWFRLMCTAACLMALLILLDRRPRWG
jgi:hypothetical protein